jgi:glycosylphosphatidylinositol transamidase (GPIT) subunit GPI8
VAGVAVLRQHRPDFLLEELLAVREVLEDLKAQFHKISEPTPAQKIQYNAEVQRVQEIAKADPNDTFTEIGNQLGALMDAYDSLSKALLQEEMQGKKVYKGEDSIGRRAIRRIIITARLDAMLVEIREMMIYSAPQELGSLWQKFDVMWKRIVEEQNAAHAEELKLAQAAQWQRANIKRKIKEQLTSILAVLFIIFWFLWVMMLIRMSETYHSLYYSPFWFCVLC